MFAMQFVFAALNIKATRDLRTHMNTRTERPTRNPFLSFLFRNLKHYFFSFDFYMLQYRRRWL